MKEEYLYTTGGFISQFDNCNLIFTKPIKKLCLYKCNNVIVHLKEKCFCAIEVIRCHNVILIFDKEVYNCQIDLSTDVSIHLNDINKPLIYIYTCSCMDIVAEYKSKLLQVKHSMFKEQWMINYYKEDVYIERLR